MAAGIDSKNPVFLACSGGVDSMVLAHILLKVGVKPEIVHCNFNLRAEDSDADEGFVKDFASSHNLPFHHKSFDTKQYAGKHGLSIQIAARELRYEFFEELLISRENAYLFLAHHADDSLETILMNLGRASGLMPLSGIEASRDKFLRPLSLCTKDEIQEYAKLEDITWREDSSNSESDYQRNYIRHKVIPELKKSTPDYTRSFINTLKHTSSDRKLFTALINEKLSKLVVVTEGQECFSLNLVKDDEMRTSLIYHWLKDKGRFDMPAIEKAIQNPGSGKVFDIENGRLLMDRDQLIYQGAKNAILESVFIEKDCKKIMTPLPMKFERFTSEKMELSKDPNRAYLDFDRLQFPLEIRSWREGDRFIPFGFKGTKKISDFLIDSKLSRFDKEEVRLLCSGDEICWVIGMRPDDRFRLTDKTKNVYFAQVITNDEDK